MMDQRTPKEEEVFRAQQKREEVQQVLGEMPATVDQFVADPKWTKNASNHFIFYSGKCQAVTVVTNDKGINWFLPGGQPTWGPGGFDSIDEAKRHLWRYLKSFENAPSA